MKADRKETEKRIKIAKGQLDGILKMIDENRYCLDISAQLMSTIALLKNVNKEILKAHIRGCVKEAMEDNDSEEKIEEALKVLEKMTNL